MPMLDVTDLSWAPEDRYLASVGLDSKVIIWCGYTLGTSESISVQRSMLDGYIEQNAYANLNYTRAS
jgi:hypothetical protein